MRLIDADATVKDIEEYQKSMVFHSYCERMHFDDMIDFAVDHIEEAPTIDAVPVVHARWNEEDGTCSACHHEAFYDEWTEPKWDYDWDENLVQTGEETHIQFIFSPYCPNCGARMDGETDEK